MIGAMKRLDLVQKLVGGTLAMMVATKRLRPPVYNEL
jgi:hypothetical protein